MTSQPDDPTAVLRYDSSAYRRHSKEIETLERRAASLSVLREIFRHEIFGTEGIVCDRERGDDRASVSRSYFGLARWVLKVEGNNRAPAAEVKQAQETRDLLHQVLATYLSVNARGHHRPQSTHGTAVTGYRELIEDLEQHCALHQIPSLLPNLLLPSSLFSRLQDSMYTVAGKPEVQELFRRLVLSMTSHDRHLHAVVTCLLRQGQPDLARISIEAIAMHCECTIFDLFRRNPPLAETYVQVLFELGRHAEASSVCETMPRETVCASPDLCEKYLRCLLVLQRNGDAVAFLNSPRTAPATPGLRKAVGVACEEIGWWLYGEGRYEDALVLLDRHAAQELGRQGRTNMNTLYRTVLEAIGDPDRVRAFDARCK